MPLMPQPTLMPLLQSPSPQHQHQQQQQHRAIGYPQRTLLPQQKQPQQQQPLAYLTSNFNPQQSSVASFNSSPAFTTISDFDQDFDQDYSNCPSLTASPVSTYSLPAYSSTSQQGSSLSAFDSIPNTTTVPRAAQGAAEPLFNLWADPMQTETWLQPADQLTSKSAGRYGHHRESSLSSLGSAGPASPYSNNTSNPQIAVTDFNDFSGFEDLNYHLVPSKASATLHPSFPGYANSNAVPINGYSRAPAVSKQNNNKSFRQEQSVGSNKPRPAPVASSIMSDSSATPAGEAEVAGRQKNGESQENRDLPDRDQSLPFDDVAINNNAPPKFDRTLTDIMNDELYHPDLVITTSAPAPQQTLTTSNNNFNKVVETANQHLSAMQSPASSNSSPFRQGSPHSATLHDFSSLNMASPQVRLGSAQQMRENSKAVQDAAWQQSLARHNQDMTPKTISPKDALLDYHEPEGESNFPLFPQPDNHGFNSDAMSKALSHQSLDGLPNLGDMSTFNFNFSPSNLDSMPTFNGLQQLPQTLQQYSFVNQPRQPSTVPSLATSRMSSAETGITDSPRSNAVQRPVDTRAEGGTYTCTYHGCPLRFDTPQLLQKHKREGHRQAHGLNSRQPNGMTSTRVDTQAGPHRCERINPSTGKPCNQIFSRPYDLTRHEDTIHNARKKKVRCEICTDEKTFSRADALTRHFRVCHPDVPFNGGKQRKARAGRSG
uniref:Related to 26S proteasome subunit RPN4 n=1 Tax=Neurospora crassa TaxID=5141 RepID=Q8WZX7_NEUCS|nr:related to 26S proteasome subunit RPN4 [Neurospora crassa]